MLAYFFGNYMMELYVNLILLGFAKSISIDSLPLFIVTVPLRGVIYSHGTADLSRPMQARRAKA